jgi:sirohydrochlorin ferrochelatase
MKQVVVILILATAAAALCPVATCADEKLGLILAAHGSPAPQWNRPVLALQEEVTEALNQTGTNPFFAVRTAMMEFTEPTIAGVIEELEALGIQRVFVLPLFIAPSGHSVFDLPAILGLYSDQEMLEQLADEGIAVVSTTMPIALGPTLDYGTVLMEVMLERTRELSEDPQSEGIVLLAHGDPRFEPIWDALCQGIGAYLCAHTSIAKFDHALVEVGQSFVPQGVPSILGMADRCEKTIVLGLYLSMGVGQMARNSSVSIGRMTFRSEEMLADHEIRCAARGLLPSERIVKWIVERATEWAAGRN